MPPCEVEEILEEGGIPTWNMGAGASEIDGLYVASEAASGAVQRFVLAILRIESQKGGKRTKTRSRNAKGP